MVSFRRWHLTTTQPYALQIAADARLSRTDYTDDQVWELMPGAGESAALTLQTRYGGRAGLASLVPMWIHEGRTIYQALTYIKSPIIAAFAPGYVQLEAQLLPAITLTAEYWAMESHAFGVRFTLANSGKQPTQLRLDLFGHVVVGGKEQKLGIIALQGGGSALYMGEVGDLHPAVVIDNGGIESNGAISPKIGANLVVPAGGTVSVRGVHAGLKTMRDSLALALHWLKQDWDAHFNAIAGAAAAMPSIETGDEALDATIAFSYQQLVQSYLKPTSSLPYGSFVATRQPTRGDSSAHDRAWNGQPPHLAYLSTLAVASIDPAMAQGIVRNYLAVQDASGRIDSKPGLGGQREGLMCAPLLARMTWNIYQQTGDKAFLTDVFPGLLKFFERWFGADYDTDKDGLPEWQHERQTGYVYFPTFGVSQSWAQGADIRCIETPDLAAFLLSEAYSLHAISNELGDSTAKKQLDLRAKSLVKALESLWNDDLARYAYRDRDTHLTAPGSTIVDSAPGDEEQLLALQLNLANRLIVHINGGTGKSPQIKLTLQGINVQGEPISEVADTNDFAWKTGRGAYTSQHIYSQIDRVRCEGLSRVYHLTVKSVDLNALDLNALLPLWSKALKKTRAKEIARLLTDENHFWRPNGITMSSAQDTRFDPSNTDGSGGVWMVWQTLLGEGLLDYGLLTEAAALVKRILAAQTIVLTEQKAFYEFYHSDQPKGLGERGHIAGIVPLYLLMRVIGVNIQSHSKVWTGGAFKWGKPVTITQHGVTVRRAKNGTQVKFPSGHTVDLPANAEWQAVIDPVPAPLPSITTPPESEPPALSQPAAPATPIIIQVQTDDDDR